jgi:amidase
MKIKNLFTYKSILFLACILIIHSCTNSSTKISHNRFNDFAYLEFEIEQMQEGFRNKQFTVKDVTQAYIERIEEIDRNGPGLKSVIIINPEAISIAEELDAELAEGKSRGPLHGIPVLLKDNIDTHDKMATTAGSRALEASFPLKDSYVAAKLREAGAVILGKTNLSEWANFRGDMSSSGWSGVGGQTKNPYDLSRNPCGSSSGSAVGVSANLTMIAIGTETNGSIVCPAHSNGIVGIKPTVGLISRSGIIPISYTQDTPGPMARTVRDAAICLGAVTGIDTTDEKSMESIGHFYKDYTQFLDVDGLKGKKIGLYTAPFGRNYKVDSLMMRTVELIKSQGAEIIEIEKILPDETGYYSFQIMLYEYKDGLNNYFMSLGENAPVKNLEELIEFNKRDSLELSFFNQQYLEMANEKEGLDSKDYLEALEVMLKGSREDGMDRVMNHYDLDAFIAPTGGPAWKTDHINGDSFHLGSSSPAAQAGYPNITVAMGNIDGLPVGISFFGRAWSEPVLIEIAFAFEQVSKCREVPTFFGK